MNWIERAEKTKWTSKSCASPHVIKLPEGCSEITMETPEGLEVDLWSDSVGTVYLGWRLTGKDALEHSALIVPVSSACIKIKKVKNQ